MKSSPIIVIAGTTATGKSALAIQLAQQINGVIINADSRQVYRELNIGTARPSQSSMQNIPHYLYGHVSVKENYNIYQYQKDVFSLLNTISKEKNIILVGGTGLYIDCVIFNYKLSENPNSTNIRNELSTLSLEQLQAKIPIDILEHLNQSERNNPRRLIRIIEKGTAIQEQNLWFPHRYFVIDLPQEILITNVKTRIEKMLENGLEDEAHRLYEQGMYKYPALNSIGYIEFLDYFNHQKSIEDVKDDICTNTLKYIKRQRTWFRRNKNATWTTDFDLILKESQTLLENA